MAEQPSPDTWLPSSQVSVPTISPSPQIGKQRRPCTGQRQPISIAMQLAAQPSPLIVLPSSHDSNDASTLSPQTTVLMQGVGAPHEPQIQLHGT
jgi:hypothetical protein